MVRLSDVKHPTVVAKGSTVTMTFAAPGLTLVATGRAMSEGGVGDTISVQNPVSYRQVQAVVTGPGQAQVGGNQAAAAQAQDVSASSRLAAAQS
jgi:flagella basal body P-ring formation protein FlgA